MILDGAFGTWYILGAEKAEEQDPFAGGRGFFTVVHHSESVDDENLKWPSQKSGLKNLQSQKISKPLE